MHVYQEIKRFRAESSGLRGWSSEFRVLGFGLQGREEERRKAQGARRNARGKRQEARGKRQEAREHAKRAREESKGRDDTGTCPPREIQSIMAENTHPCPGPNVAKSIPPLPPGTMLMFVTQPATRNTQDATRNTQDASGETMRMQHAHPHEQVISRQQAGEEQRYGARSCILYSTLYSTFYSTLYSTL